jgi:hypothetical protein
MLWTSSCRALQNWTSSPPITHSRRMRHPLPTNQSATPPRTIITALVGLQLSRGPSKVSRGVSGGGLHERSICRGVSKLGWSSFSGIKTAHVRHHMLKLGSGVVRPSITINHCFNRYFIVYSFSKKEGIVISYDGWFEGVKIAILSCKAWLFNLTMVI